MRRGRGAGNRDFFNKNTTSRSSPRPASPWEQKSNVKVLTRPKEDSLKIVVATRPKTYTPEPEVADEAERPRVKVMTRAAQSNQEVKPNIRKSNAAIDSKKLINESMSFEESISDMLMDNPHFTVTAAIGPQSSGKSTILSMLAGNSPHDKYRHYVFRPASRDAIESSHYQTYRIYAFVSKARGIFLDCQPTNSASISEEAAKGNRKNEEKLEGLVYTETLHLIAFLLQISNTILVCTDFSPDLEMMRALRAAEMLRANFSVLSNLGLPILNFNRKTNIVFVHTRANAEDFSFAVKRERVQIIRALFSDSTRLRISDDDDLALMMLAVLKPRKDTLAQMYYANSKETELELEEIECFEEGIRKMRHALIGSKKDPFSEQPFTEKQWLIYAKGVWKDQSFNAAVDNYSNNCLI